MIKLSYFSTRCGSRTADILLWRLASSTARAVAQIWIALLLRVDQLRNVGGSPCCCSGTQLDWPREAARRDACPPCGFRHWNDCGNGGTSLGIAYDLLQQQ